jgi:hypothetical protein
MAITTGNASQVGYNAVESPPGYETVVWMGAALIDSTPAIAWDIVDRNGNPLVLATNAKVADVGLGFFGDILGTATERIKFGASATDTNTYVVNSSAIPVGGILTSHDTQLLLNPWAYVVVGSGFTPRLFLHASNVASSNTARAAVVSPGSVIPVSSTSAPPVVVQVRVVTLVPSGGPKKSDPLYLSENQQRRLVGLPAN